MAEHTSQMLLVALDGGDDETILEGFNSLEARWKAKNPSVQMTGLVVCGGSKARKRADHEVVGTGTENSKGSFAQLFHEKLGTGAEPRIRSPMDARLRKAGVLNPQEGVEPADVGRKVTSHTPNPEYEGDVKSTN